MRYSIKYSAFFLFLNACKSAPLNVYYVTMLKKKKGSLKFIYKKNNSTKENYLNLYENNNVCIKMFKTILHRFKINK